MNKTKKIPVTLSALLPVIKYLCGWALKCEKMQGKIILHIMHKTRNRRQHHHTFQNQKHQIISPRLKTFPLSACLIEISAHNIHSVSEANMSAQHDNGIGPSGGKGKGKKEQVVGLPASDGSSASVRAFGNQSISAQDFGITDNSGGTLRREPKRSQQAAETLGGVALTLRIEGVEKGEMNRVMAERPERGSEMPSGRVAPAAEAKKRRLGAASQRVAASSDPTPAPARPAATKEEVVILHHLMQQILDQGKFQTAELARLREEVEILGRQTETTRGEAESAKAVTHETLAMVEKVEVRRVEREQRIWEHVTAALGMMGRQVASLEVRELGEEPRHAPAQVPATQLSEDPSEMVDLAMTGQTEDGVPVEDEEEVDENPATYRRGVSVADSFEFVSEERRALIEPAVPRVASHPRPPAAPRSMRQNQKDPEPVRAPRIQILRRPEEAKAARPQGPLQAPKMTWAQKAAAKPEEDKFTAVGRKGKAVKSRPNAVEKEGQLSALTPHKGSIPVDQRTLVFARKGAPEVITLAQKGKITNAVNLALFKAAPKNTHVRVEMVRCSPRGTITVSAAMGADAKMLMLFKKQILEAANRVEASITDVGTNEQWVKLKVMGVPFEMYRGQGGMEEIAACLEAENGLVVPLAPRWLRQWRWINERWEQGTLRFAPVVITVRGQEAAGKYLAGGLRLGGMKMKVEKFVEEGKDTQCDKCAAWGHSEFRCPQLGVLRCGLCGDGHRTSEHACQVAGCGRKDRCRHLQAKCANCGGGHTAAWTGCPFARSARAAARGQGGPRVPALEKKKESGAEREGTIKETPPTQPTQSTEAAATAPGSEHPMT